MEKQKGLVSIIVPAYKVQDYLSKCLDSLVSQTYINIEIIVIDDGSPDNSLSICKQYALRDSRIHLFTQKNAGVAAARMNGFLHSHGEWIMFVDADDYVSHNIINLMLQIEERYHVDMISCQYYDVVEGKAIPALVRPATGYYDKERIRQLLSKNFLYDKNLGMAGMTGYLCTRLFKRCFVQGALEAGRNLIHSEDQIGIFRTLYDIDSMFVMKEPLYYYVARKGQATRSYNAAYWKNFELFFTRLKQIDQKNYLKRQLPDRAVLILKDLIKMEFTNKRISIFNRYFSVKKNFSTALCVIGKDADTSKMGVKERLQFYLIIHQKFLLYGIFMFLNRILKSFCYRRL
jgi:glycosyltransferase involved in cell wall biosynthesis